MHRNSGAGDGNPVVWSRVDPGRKFPHDDIGRGRAIRGTIPKIEEVYTNEAMSN